jgi:hypothetical protein
MPLSCLFSDAQPAVAAGGDFVWFGFQRQRVLAGRQPGHRRFDEDLCRSMSFTVARLAPVWSTILRSRLVWRTTPCSVARLTVPRDPQTIFKPI